MDAFHLIGVRWSALIACELTYGPRSFSSLRHDLHGISANMLSMRLGQLRKLGVIRKVQLNSRRGHESYEATDWALELRPVLCGLNAWAWHPPCHGCQMTAVSLMLSLETFFRSGSAEGFHARMGFRFASTSFVATVENHKLAIKAAAVDEVDVCFDAPPSALAAIFLHGTRFDPSVVVQGEVAVAQKFSTLFRRPRIHFCRTLPRRRFRRTT